MYNDSTDMGARDRTAGREPLSSITMGKVGNGRQVADHVEVLRNSHGDSARERRRAVGLLRLGVGRLLCEQALIHGGSSHPTRTLFT